MNAHSHRIITSKNPCFEDIYALQIHRAAKIEQDIWQRRIKKTRQVGDEGERTYIKVPKDRLLELIVEAVAEADEPLASSEILDAVADQMPVLVTQRTMNRALVSFIESGVLVRTYRCRKGQVGVTKVPVYSLPGEE